jgi:hypothetical protein
MQKISKTQFVVHDSLIILMKNKDAEIKKIYIKTAKKVLKTAYNNCLFIFIITLLLIIYDQYRAIFIDFQHKSAISWKFHPLSRPRYL